MDENDILSDILLLKNVFKIIFSLISFIISFLPILLVISIPLIIVGIFMPGETGQKSNELKSQYDLAYVEVRQELDSWINAERNRHSGVDDVIIDNNFMEDFKLLVCIDAQRYEQKFDEVTKNDIKELYRTIYKKESKVVTDIVPEYIKKYKYDSNGNPILDSNGNHEYTIKVDYKEVKKLYITITMKSLEEISAELSLDYEQLNYMYQNSIIFEQEGQKVGTT